MQLTAYSCEFNANLGRVRHKDTGRSKPYPHASGSWDLWLLRVSRYRMARMAMHAGALFGRAVALVNQLCFAVTFGRL